MFREMVRQPVPLQFPFPIVRRYVVVGDLTTERLRELPRDAVQVLRPRTRELAYLTEVGSGVGKNRSHHSRDIRRSDRRRLAPPERQLDPIPFTDARAGEEQKQNVEEG